MTSGSSTLFASPSTVRAIVEARTAAILIGSYDGSGNYGDIAQLDAALELGRAPRPRPAGAAGARARIPGRPSGLGGTLRATAVPCTLLRPRRRHRRWSAAGRRSRGTRLRRLLPLRRRLPKPTLGRSEARDAPLRRGSALGWGRRAGLPPLLRTSGRRRVGRAARPGRRRGPALVRFPRRARRRLQPGPGRCSARRPP